MILAIIKHINHIEPVSPIIAHGWPGMIGVITVISSPISASCPGPACMPTTRLNSLLPVKVRARRVPNGFLIKHG